MKFDRLNDGSCICHDPADRVYEMRRQALLRDDANCVNACTLWLKENGLDTEAERPKVREVLGVCL